MTPASAPSRVLRRLVPVALLLTVVALLLAACGSGSDKKASTTTTSADLPGAGKPPVTMGDKNFPEQFLLGQLYKQALEARGYRVRLKDNIGASEIVDRALVSGSIDMYPEYTGVIVQELKGSTARLRSVEQTYREAKAYEEGRGFTLLARTPFEDKNALALTHSFADGHGDPHTVEDLRKLGPLRLGAPPEYEQREAGLKGLREVYRLNNLRLEPLTIGQQYTALTRRRIDVANVFTTDGPLQTGRYVVLRDPRSVFGFQNVAPVVSQRKLRALGPEFRRVTDSVSAQLSTGAMQAMNAAVTLHGQEPAVVARNFLRARKLL